MGVSWNPGFWNIRFEFRIFGPRPGKHRTAWDVEGSSKAVQTTGGQADLWLRPPRKPLGVADSLDNCTTAGSQNPEFGVAIPKFRISELCINEGRVRPAVLTLL